MCDYALRQESLLRHPGAVVEGSGREEEARPVRRQVSRLRFAPLDKRRGEGAPGMSNNTGPAKRVSHKPSSFDLAGYFTKPKRLGIHMEIWGTKVVISSAMIMAAKNGTM